MVELMILGAVLAIVSGAVWAALAAAARRMRIAENDVGDVLHFPAALLAQAQAELDRDCPPATDPLHEIIREVIEEERRQNDMPTTRFSSQPFYTVNRRPDVRAITPAEWARVEKVKQQQREWRRLSLEEAYDQAMKELN